MDYRLRSKRDREVERALEATMTYSHVAAHLNGPNSEPGEAVKAMPEETKKLLKDLKTRHVQNYPVRYSESRFDID